MDLRPGHKLTFEARPLVGLSIHAVAKWALVNVSSPSHYNYMTDKGHGRRDRCTALAQLVAECLGNLGLSLTNLHVSNRKRLLNRVFLLAFRQYALDVTDKLKRGFDGFERRFQNREITSDRTDIHSDPPNSTPVYGPNVGHALWISLINSLKSLACRGRR